MNMNDLPQAPTRPPKIKFHTLTDEDFRAAWDAQLDLERLAVDMGIKKYRDALEEGREGDLPPGQQLLKAAMLPMAEAVKKWLAEVGEGIPARNASVYHFINMCEPETLAWHTARAALRGL